MMSRGGASGAARRVAAYLRCRDDPAFDECSVFDGIVASPSV